MITLNEDCIFISDAHYSNGDRELCDILKNESSSMIIFMGDIFELLFGEIKQSIEDNLELINVINNLSLDKKIIYLEGNHDFNLQNIFPNIDIYPINKQPLIVSYRDKKIALAHGDIGISFIYSLYTKAIRNKYLLSIISFFNTMLNNKILNTLKEKKKKKNKCHEIDDFQSMAKNRIKNYNEKYIIEGHFHQDKIYQIDDRLYINLPAFACSKDIKKIKDLIK